jgi:uncharacterized protein (DUF1778 family)
MQRTRSTSRRAPFNLQVDAKTFKRFKKALDKPPADNSRLRRLLATQAPWERSV